MARKTRIAGRILRIIAGPIVDNPAMQLLCAMGVHSRSRRDVYRYNKITYGECRWCHTRMAKSKDGKWAAVAPSAPTTIVDESENRPPADT